MLFLIVCIVALRIITLHDNELSWDVLGYYIHLPALFIYNDHGLNDLGWIYKLLEQYPLTGSLYQISSGPDGNPIFFFLMGMSFFYLPWFALAHLLASFSGYPADGFSLPYQYTMALGVISYTIIGLVYFRKILLRFFSDRIVAVVMIIIVLGTNYYHFMANKNLETANILFLMVTLVTWNTIRWHEEHKLKNLIAIAVFIVLAALSKPSEVLVILVPLFWGVYNRTTLKYKFELIWKYKNQFIIAIASAFILALPQIIYWYSETGSILYDSYKNPGVGLDLTSPHIANILFSFKKGWLIYTPVMIFSIIGFVMLYRKNRGVFVPLLVYSVVAFYIIASWTEWWYGASYSIRPMITLYPLLGISLGYFITSLKYSNVARFSISVLIVFFIALNLFQMWQLNNYIIEPYRMTKNYYFAIFGKTKVTEADRNHLAPDLTFNSGAKFSNESAFRHRNMGMYDFEEYGGNYSKQIINYPEKGNVLKMDSSYTFSPDIRSTFRGITSKEYAWIKAKVDVFIPEGYKEELPLLVMTFDRKGGSYNYHSYSIDTNIYKPGTWGEIRVEMMTSNVRSTDDFFKIYMWHRGKAPVYIDNLKADAFEPM